MMNREGRRLSLESRSGFTLIELIVASVLAAVLLVSVGYVLRTVLRQKNADSALLSPRAAEQFRRDLQNATHFRSSPTQIDLLGQLAIDPREYYPLWRMAEVSYQIRATSQGGLLIRRQRMSARVGTQVSVEPIWLGITTIHLETSFLDADPRNVEPGRSASGWKALPPSFRVRLQDASRRTCFSACVVGVSYD